MTAWDLNRAALRHHLVTDKIEDFLRWSTIEKTMFVGDVGFVRMEFEELMSGYDPTDIISLGKYSALAETPIGNPKPLFGWTSGNLIHQYYHLKQWLDRSHQDISNLSSIVEVGAGYGAMCLICHRLGFKGRYYIFDLPELEQIQAYYLDHTLPESRSHIHWLRSSSLEKSCDLFIACHSLSEMSLSKRERLLSQVDAKEYLFASSYEFEGVDNDTWLRKFAESKPGYEWQQYAHLHQENALYLVGVKV
jgi:hypothetical protein